MPGKKTIAPHSPPKRIPPQTTVKLLSSLRAAPLKVERPPVQNPTAGQTHTRWSQSTQNAPLSGRHPKGAAPKPKAHSPTTAIPPAGKKTPGILQATILSLSKRPIKRIAEPSCLLSAFNAKASYRGLTAGSIKIAVLDTAVKPRYDGGFSKPLSYKPSPEIKYKKPREKPTASTGHAKPKIEEILPAKVPGNILPATEPVKQPNVPPQPRIPSPLPPPMKIPSQHNQTSVLFCDRRAQKRFELLVANKSQGHSPEPQSFFIDHCR